MPLSNWSVSPHRLFQRWTSTARFLENMSPLAGERARRDGGCLGHVTCVAADPEADSQPRMTAVTGRRPTVLLIVEDDSDMRSLLCDELWSDGYQLREAKDGDEALRAVLESVPDLILTDLKMPAGGFDYVSRLKTFAPQCPIVLMTAPGGRGQATRSRWPDLSHSPPPPAAARILCCARVWRRSANSRAACPTA